jgi:hypothetical protein
MLTILSLLFAAALVRGKLKHMNYCIRTVAISALLLFNPFTSLIAQTVTVESLDQDGTRRTTLIASLSDDSTKLRYSGQIVESNDVVKLFSHPNLREIVMSSGGGSVKAAIQLANIIRERKILLTIDGVCLSSCANYLFTAARRKRLLPGSLLAIHGSLSTNPSPELRHSDEALVERAFISKLGIDARLYSLWDNYADYLKSSGKLDSVLGQNPPAGCSKARLWAPSRTDLEVFGVMGIEEFWYPTTQKEFAMLGGEAKAIAEYVAFVPAAEIKKLCH